MAVGTGYSESKWVCEQLLALASQKTALPSISVRAGQIAGSGNGAWNVHEWVPSLIKSSIHLGCLPALPSVSSVRLSSDIRCSRTMQNVSWMNVTSFASAILEARNVPKELSPLHLAHPRPILWNTLFEPVRAKYNLGLVPYNHWFAKLAASAEDITGTCDPAEGGNGTSSPPSSDDSDTASTISASEVAASIELSARATQYGRLAEMSTVLALNPAVKLLSFFSAYNNSTSLSLNDSSSSEEAMGLPQLDVTKSVTLAAKDSLSVERLPCLGPADMLRWLNYWERTGFLPSSLCSDNVTQCCTHGIKT